VAQAKTLPRALDMNHLKRQEEEAPKPPEDPTDVKLLTEIRDLLASARMGARV
jgi:large-conductance mechanosensitive channel